MHLPPLPLHAYSLDIKRQMSQGHTIWYWAYFQSKNEEGNRWSAIDGRKGEGMRQRKEKGDGKEEITAIEI